MGAVTMSPEEAERMPVRTFNHLIGFEQAKNEEEKNAREQQKKRQQLESFNRRTWGGR